jgi:hypothetical protein
LAIVRGGAFILGLAFAACGGGGGGHAPDAGRGVADGAPPDAALPPPVDAAAVWDLGPPDAAPPPDAGCAAPPTGAVVGQVCAPNGRLWLVGATVTVEWTDACTGEARVAEATTDASGRFAFDALPAGPQVVHIARGSFRGERAVQVNPGEIVDLSAGDRKACLSAEATRLAVVTGRYDRVQDLLTDLGLDQFDQFDGVEDTAAAEALLTDWDRLRQYDVLFLTCGIAKDAFPRYDDIVANLRRYVAEGGSLYVSDYSYFFFEDAFPDALDFYGDDSDWQAGPLMGGAPQRVQARIGTDELRAYMGADTVDVDFPEDGTVRTEHWVVAQSAAPDVTVLLAADVVLCASHRFCGPGPMLADVPLLVSYRPPGAMGVAVFTSFHDEANLSPDIERVLFYLVFVL